MKKIEALKNVFQNDNWDDIEAAKDKMYTDKRVSEKKEEIETEKADSNDVTLLKAKITSIERKYDELIQNQNENIQKVIQKINDLIITNNRHDETLKNFAAEVKQLKVLPQQQRQEYKASQPPKEESNQSSEKAPLDKPIDRTGVAPSSVSVEKMFNFSNKKF